MWWVLIKRSKLVWKLCVGRVTYAIVSQGQLTEYHKRGWLVHAGPYYSCDDARKEIE